MIIEELDCMTKVFDHSKKILKRNKKFGPVLGYFNNDYVARIDVDDRLDKMYLFTLKINDIQEKERFRTFAEAYMHLKHTTKRYRLFLLF